MPAIDSPQSGQLELQGDRRSKQFAGKIAEAGLPSGRLSHRRVRLLVAMDRDSKKTDPNANAKVTDEASGKDVVLIHGPSPDGKGLAVLRHRENRLERGLVMPIEHGKPIHGEVVTLQPRREFPLLCDVKVEYSPTDTQGALPADSRTPAKGPGQVATDEYRTNWDRIFHSRTQSSGDLN